MAKFKLLNIWFLAILPLVFLNGCKKNETNPLTVKDIDGNVYHCITIGTQVWMIENLKTTRYNDGSIIPKKTDSEWSYITTGVYCNYNNDESIVNTYGRLYNWYAVNTGKLAPKGWHIPTEEDWNILSDYLGGEIIAGGKLKESGTSHWIYPNEGATNEVGFSALPAGDYYGSYIHLGEYAFWWSSTECFSGYASGRYLVYDSNYFGINQVPHYLGFSVRCIKD